LGYFPIWRPVTRLLGVSHVAGLLRRKIPEHEERSMPLFDPLVQKIKPSLEAFFTRHQAAISRFHSNMVLIGFLFFWPFLYVAVYGLFVCVLLAAYYFAASLIGIWVPSGGVFAAISDYYHSPIPNTLINIVGAFIVAFWVFMLRSLYRRTYGVIEMIAGALIVGSVNLDGPDQKAVVLILMGGLYVMVRGLDNLDKGTLPESGLAHWLRYYPGFFRFWIFGHPSHPSPTLTEAADPFYWRRVADIDPTQPPVGEQPENQTRKQG
jgi:hypothetical protein